MAKDDETWRRLTAEAERLTAMSSDTVSVWAFRRRRLRVFEGLEAGDDWVHGLEEPVRWRWFLSSTWQEVQSVEAATLNLESFMRERPDL